MSESNGGTVQRYQPPQAPVSQQNETGAAMLGARARAEIEARVVVAMNRPRDMERFRSNMQAACSRVLFADAAMYEKPVGDGKNASGFSIRFAEECARNYCNLDTSVIVVSEDDERRVLEAVGVDYETNVVHRTQAVVPKYVERLHPRQGEEILGERTNSRGVKTYRIRANDDAMFTSHQRAAAKAKREVILMHIPSDIREECEGWVEETLKAMRGDPVAYLASVVKAFEKIAITPEQLAEYLGKSLSVANTSELAKLRRIFQGISQGETTWKDTLAAKAPDAATASTTPARSCAPP